MDKKYEEMTRAQLGTKADEILKKAKLDIYGNADVSTQIKNIDNLQEIINIMKTFGIDAIKEKIDNILGGFLVKNKEYTVEVYISNGVTNNRIGQVIIATDRVLKVDDKKLILEWNIENDMRFNKFSFQYDEIMDCYKGNYEEEKLRLADIVVITLKNGMKFEFECCGLRAQ